MGLLDFQSKNLEKIKKELVKNLNCQIIGNVGDGRSYTIQYLKDEYIVIFIENADKDLTYMPVINALKNFESANKLIDFNTSIRVSLGHLSLALSAKSKKLDEIENTIIRVINKLRKIRKVIFVVRYDQLNQSIKSLFSKIGINKKRVLRSKLNEVRIIYLTSEDSRQINLPEVHFLKLSSSEQSKEDIMTEIGLNTEIINSLKYPETEFLFRLIGDDIGCLKTLIDKMNSNCISFAANTDRSNLIYDIINERYNGDLQTTINKLLAYCSFSEDFLLSTNDLAFLLDDININDLKKCVTCAQKDMLINYSNDRIQVFIILLKNIYKEQFDSKKGKIYNKLCSMISNLYPSNYRQKVIYATLANDINVDIYKAQYCMQQIREKGECAEHFSNEDFRYFKLIKAYNTACQYIAAKRYDEIQDLFNDVGFLPICLSAEINLLISQADTKSLNQQTRNDALVKLNSINGELDGDLSYRLENFKIVANVHNGNYNTAKQCYESLMKNLSDKIARHSSNELLYLYYTLCRKSNMLIDFQRSFDSMEKAKNYFNGRNDLPQDNYFALVNYFGIAIRNMKLDVARQTLEEINKFKECHYDRNFLREYIFENNKIIFNYLDGTTCDKTCNKFNELLDKVPNSADKFLITNNYAVFTALSGDVNAAIDILSKIANETSVDKEGVYLFRYKLNYSIFNYILDNKNRNLLQKDLNELDLNIDYPNRVYMLRERDLIVQTMQKSCGSPLEWLDNFNANFSSCHSKNGYELGFAITPLFHWSDD